MALDGLRDTVSYEVKILGDGPLRKRWTRMAHNTGVGSCCQWRGAIPLKEAIEEYGWADVFVFTSLRDTFGTVVLEALGNGVPVICFDHFGAGDAVTDTCGMKIPVTNPRDAVRALAMAIRHISEHPGALEELRSGALTRAREFLWENNAKRMIAYYRAVIADAGNGPELGEGNEIR
jgi:glycosyltransferase involved in cell wall biosynthesis